MTVCRCYAPDVGETIGSRVRAAREAQEMSQAECARRCGWSRAQQSHVELRPGDPTLATLRTLADVLGVTVASLIGE